MEKKKKKDSSEKPPIPPIKPVEGEDYYIENGLLVMTEAYHLKRGFCCGSKCRHCPYDHKNVR